MSYKILAINPGSTSTKVAVFDGDKEVFSKNISHDSSELEVFQEISDQFEYRKQVILKEMEQAGQKLAEIDAFSARGGGLTSLRGGVYQVGELLLAHAKAGFSVKHPAMLGAQLAGAFADEYGKPAFVVNPPDVDEFQEVARVTGLKGIYRESRIHALNQKEVGIRYARSKGRQYEDMNLIICHIGGGVSVTAHRKGLMVDSNDIAQGDGPMAPTRCGQIPVKDIVKLCFSGQYSEQELLAMTTKTGGLVHHLGTSDARAVEAMVKNGNEYAKIIYDAMVYQIGKTAGSMAAVLHGMVDAIIMTGGISHDPYVTGCLSDMLSFIAPIVIMPGEFEMEALAAGACRVLKGQETAKEYSGIPVWDGFSG